jgi:hypothetical protein
MRAKAYLNFGNTRATWAYFADDLYQRAINKAGEKKLAKNLRLNPFLQNWELVGQKVPEYLNEIIKLGKKYEIKVEALNPTHELCRKMPAWYHIGADPNKHQMNNVGWSKCLQENHEVKTAGDLEDITSRLKDQTHNQESNECQCTNCNTDRLFDCETTMRCTKHAERLLDTLLPKWDPRKKDKTEEDENTDEGDTTNPFHLPTKMKELADGL